MSSGHNEANVSSSTLAWGAKTVSEPVVEGGFGA